MVDVVKEAFDINIDDPFRTIPASANLTECRMTRPTFPKSMSGLAKDRLIDPFQDDSCHFLHELVISAWNTQWTFLAILFRKVSPSYGFWTIRFLL